MAGSEVQPDVPNQGGVIIRIPDWSSVFLAVPLVITGALLWCGKLSETFSRPFTGFIDSVFLGRGNGDIPPVTLRLARSLRADFRYDEAIGECRRQLEYHPRTFELWEEMVLADLDGGRFDSARRIVTEATSHLSGPEIQTLRDLILSRDAEV